jgi:DNA modification methylase
MMLHTMNKLQIGDCRQLMPDFPGRKSVDLILTDPPYKGLDYERGFGIGRRVEHDKDWYCSNFNTEKYKYGGGYVPYGEWLPKAYAVLKDSGSIVIFESKDNIFELKNALDRNNFIYRSLGIWHISNKVTNVSSSKAKKPISSYEVWIWATVSDKYYFDSSVSLKDLYSTSTVRYDYGEESYGVEVGGKKPVEILIPIIKALSPLQGTVLDCFAGSGSTCLAARKSERRWIAIEINPALEETILKKTRELDKSIFSF